MERPFPLHFCLVARKLLRLNSERGGAPPREEERGVKLFPDRLCKTEGKIALVKLEFMNFSREWYIYGAEICFGELFSWGLFISCAVHPHFPLWVLLDIFHL